MTGGDQRENGHPPTPSQGPASGLGPGPAIRPGQGQGSSASQSGLPTRQDPPAQDYDDFGAPRTRWLTVTDAMEYLDAVKLEFRDQPEIYDEFLAIMGRFKTKQMLPPDVIVEVARLFRGRNTLVLSFNRFLPEGFKIGPGDIERMEEECVAKEQATARANRSGGGGGSMSDNRGRGLDGDIGKGNASGPGVPGHVLDADVDRSMPSGDESEAEDHLGDPENGFEFDHAIHYVTTIKRRFSDDIGTYKAFLEILHTYQREQQGINHVLEQVTDLFADEPDLLREFTYFLPDGVQAQAKERLDRAAVEAEMRLSRAQNGQRSQRPPPHRLQGGHQRGQGRGRQGNMGRDHARGSRVQHRTGPGSQSPYRFDNDIDQEWRDQRGHGRSRAGAMNRGFQGGYGSRSQYSNGGMGSDPDRQGPRQHYAGNNHPHPQRMSRHARKGRQVWCRAEDYEIGPDGNFKGPKKRARAPDDTAGIGEGRGWSSVGSQGGTIKTSGEHQLFDQARQVLSSGGDANDWTEFLKCLDLFSNQILGREELLEMVQDLFEAHNEFDLMDEFKSLVYRRGELEPPPRDAMPTLGLSEINFQSAKMCTPSYRELPRDYQLTSCSGRSADEDVVLNDTWVSVPVGSEDSTTFKHMRRNPNEEALFKMEDERFELDMLIDGVAAVIARLEPVEEEIEALRATAESALGQSLEVSDETSGAGTSPTDGPERVVGSLPQFQYRLDRRTLGALHLSTLSRLYGEHGAEVLELLRKNPAVAIPVVLKRLRQKEQAWCAAREEAKTGWKELAQKHFHRSLDHRSHHFRREDKRHTSSRVLLQEIKDKKVEEDPQKAAVVKAARELVHNAQKDVLLGRVSPTSTAADADSVSGQGSAGETEVVLDGVRSDGGSGDRSETLPVNGEDSAVTGGRPRSKEGIRLMRKQAEENPPHYMFAHLTLSYPAEHTASIHVDIMELLSHTLARRPPSEEDVRHASTVVADLLPTFFAIEKPERKANGASSSIVSAHAGGLPVGSGAFGQVVLSMPVLSSDDDSDRENSSGDDRRGDRGASSPCVADGASAKSSDPGGVMKDKRASSDVGDVLDRSLPIPLPQDQEVFFTTTDFYLVLRMHHLLAERLTEAKKLCRDAGLSRQTVVASPQEILRASARAGTATTDEIGSTKSSGGDGGKEDTDYKTFLGHLYDLLEDKITTERYDEGVRQLVGNQVYQNASPGSLASPNLNQLSPSIKKYVFGDLMLSHNVSSGAVAFESDSAPLTGDLDLLYTALAGFLLSCDHNFMQASLGYALCSLDKLVVGLLQNLYRASADKVFHKLTQLYYYERKTQSEGVSPATYKNHAQQLLQRSGKEVVRAQYHPGTKGGTGSWLVEPTLRLEYIGRLGTQGRRQESPRDNGTPAHGLPAADAIAPTDTPMEV